MGTVVVLAVLAAAVFFAARSLIKGRKGKGSSCGGDCGSCGCCRR